MLADFRFETAPEVNCVVVRLFWQGDTRMAYLLIPGDVQDIMKSEDLDNPESLPAETALGYAVTVAALSGRNLRISGDDSVWPAEWGSLIYVTSTQ